MINENPVKAWAEDAQRVDKALRSQGLTWADMGRSIGASNQTLTNWKERGISKSGQPKVANFLGKSLEWLISGIEDRNISVTKIDLDQLSSKLKPVILFDSTDDLPSGGFVLIDKLNVQAAAGKGCENGDFPTEKTPIAFRADWIKKSKAVSTNLKITTIDGDSMEPTLFHGDDALVDLDQNVIVNGFVYAFIYENALIVKRLYKSGGKVIAHSDNEADPKYKYDQEYGESDTILIVGRIVNRSGSGNL